MEKHEYKPSKKLNSSQSKNSLHSSVKSSPHNSSKIVILKKTLVKLKTLSIDGSKKSIRKGLQTKSVVKYQFKITKINQLS